VHGDAHGAQVAHSQYTANDVAAKVVEDQNFPYRLSLSGEDRANWRNSMPVRMCMMVVALVLCNSFVEVEDLLQRC